MQHPFIRTTGLMAAMAVSSMAFVGCTATTPHDRPSMVSAAQPVDANAEAALSRLYATVPGSRELVARSAGVLVFPEVVGASLVVGAQHGTGVLRVHGRTEGYYSTTTASVGLQAGAQSKSVIYVFNTQEALDRFRASNGWTAGVDATVAVASLGANGHVDTRTAQAPIAGFVMNNAGIEAGASVQGSKITRIMP